MATVDFYVNVTMPKLRIKCVMVAIRILVLFPLGKSFSAWFERTAIDWVSAGIQTNLVPK